MLRKARNKMEKKVPERKVRLRDEDVFYVYDKRINRCIKGDCEGTVKYGLVLKVGVSEDETLNCFECNKCHMKYTPYPNYVRLTKTDMLTISNQDEVTARDLKRQEDARKQALRDRKNAGRRNGMKTDGRKRPEGKTYERRPYEKRPYEGKTYERKTYEGRPYERKSYEASYVKKSYGTDSYERKPFEYKTGEKVYGKKPYDRTAYGRTPYDKKKSYGGQGYEQRPKTFHGKGKNANIVITSGNYASNGYRKPYFNQNGESKKPFAEEEYRSREY